MSTPSSLRILPLVYISRPSKVNPLITYNLSDFLVFGLRDRRTLKIAGALRIASYTSSGVNESLAISNSAFSVKRTHREITRRFMRIRISILSVLKLYSICFAVSNKKTSYPHVGVAKLSRWVSVNTICTYGLTLLCPYVVRASRICPSTRSVKSVQSMVFFLLFPTIPSIVSFVFNV